MRPTIPKLQAAVARFILHVRGVVSSHTKYMSGWDSSPSSRKPPRALRPLDGSAYFRIVFVYFWRTTSFGSQPEEPTACFCFLRLEFGVSAAVIRR